MDLGGYYTPSQDGYRFFLIIVDDYTRYIWVWFLTTKNMQATSAALLQWKKLCGKSIRM
jgi:transposase InsO family protein